MIIHRLCLCEFFLRSLTDRNKCSVLKFYLCCQYSPNDGEFRFAQIKAKSKRKAIGSVQMDDVLGFAPRGDRSVYKYENDKNLAYKNLTSGDPEAKVYELIAKGEKGLVRYEFEPDDEMLDEVMVKYPRSVVR